MVAIVAGGVLLSWKPGTTSLIGIPTTFHTMQTTPTRIRTCICLSHIHTRISRISTIVTGISIVAAK